MEVVAIINLHNLDTNIYFNIILESFYFQSAKTFDLLIRSEICSCDIAIVYKSKINTSITLLLNIS